MADKKTITLTKGLIKLPDGTYIAPYTDTKGALDICDIGQSLMVDETEGLRRRLNGSIVHIDNHTQPFANKLKQIKTAYPNLFCTETEWSTIKNSNTLGQVGKFVFQENQITNYTYNATTAGTLTKENGIVSGFSTENYLKFPTNFQPGTANWEMVFKIKTVDTAVEGQQIIMAIGNGNTAETRYATRIYINDCSTFGISVTYNGTAWDINTDGATEGSVGTYNLLLNTVYYIKFAYDGNSYQLSYSLDGEEYITDINVPSTTPMFNSCTQSLIGAWMSTNPTGPFLGSIDLNESYININGERWWNGVTTSITEPYVRLPRVVCMQGTLDFTNIDEFCTTHSRRLVAQKKPTAANTHWYRWYSDGWLEQGGRVLQNGATNANWTDYTITMPKTYKDVYYNVVVMTGHENNTDSPSVYNQTTSSFMCQPYNNQGTAQWSTWGWSTIPKATDANLTGEYIEPQFPYFIQIATGSYTTTSVRNDWEIINPYTIFDYKYSYSPVNNASWLISDMQSNLRSAYPYAYEALCVELNNSIQTNETVILPSGGKYTKHLQTVTYDPAKITQVGSPTITDNGIMTVSNTANHIKFNISNITSLSTSNNFSLKFKFKFSPNKSLVSTFNTNATPNALQINCLDTKVETSLSFTNSTWDVIKETNYNFIEGNWYSLRFSFDNRIGYKLEIAEEQEIFFTDWHINNLERITPASNFLLFGGMYGASGAVIDLKTIVFRYSDNTKDYQLTCIKYDELVWDKSEHVPTSTDYDKKFIVDRVNETFRLPLKVDRELNNGENIYYFVGDVAQNTSLIDIGRLTESLAKKVDRVDFDMYSTNRYIVATYSNGWNWWRKWSDGWVEQGGYISASTSTGQVNNLLVKMKNANYNINITPVVSTWSGGLSSVFGLTTTSFQLWTSDDSSFNSCPVIWEVKGYMA